MPVHGLGSASLPIPDALNLNPESVRQLPLVQTTLNPVAAKLFSEGVQPVVPPPVVPPCILLIWR